MTWNVEYTDEFEERFWNGLSESEQEDIAATVSLLEARGPNLPFPYSSGIEGSRHGHMRELRVQSGGRPIRIFYALRPSPFGDFADRRRQDGQRPVLRGNGARR